MHSQLWCGLAALTTLSNHALGNPVAYWGAQGNASLNMNHLLGRDAEEFDPADLSFITKMAAIGDSYSAGIGAGDRLGTDADEACSRYDHAYPYLIHTDDRLGDSANRVFQFESCSGAVVAEVINDQIPNISGNQQVILLSAGGNDAELVQILNLCIYQFFSIDLLWGTKVRELIEATIGFTEKMQWSPVLRTCEQQLDRTKEIIASDAFSKSLDSVISAAKGKLASDGMIYYTGYAKFWAEDLSSECDDVSWSIGTYVGRNGSILKTGLTVNQNVPYFREKVYLMKAHRSTMNDLVDAVNSQLSKAVGRAGSQVKFINYDSWVGYFGGRFCETGVDESTTESNTRAGLMFYEFNSMDWAGNNPWKRSDDPLFNGTFEGDINFLTDASLIVDPDAVLTYQALVTSPSTESISAMSAEIATTATLQERSILPDGYGRVFHPQILLHKLIAEQTIYEMTNNNEIDNGYPEIPAQLSLDSCPYYPPESSGNQLSAMASYINPLADPAAWDRLIEYPVNKMPILIANVVNGPDSAVDTDWADVIERGSASGKIVLGYVRTGYLGVSSQKFLTRLGSGNLADWTAQIEEDIDMWYTLYGNKIGGIFFDEGWPECGDDNKYVNLYKHINDYTKRTHPGAYTVLNPGSPMASCYEDTMDTLLTFELSYEAYTNSYTPNDWVAKDSRKIWHIIYDVPETAIDEVVKLSQSRGAGFIEITKDVMPNPYDNLDSTTYLQSVLDAVKGGSLKNDSASSWPSGSSAGLVSDLSVLESDYSSAKISWSAASNAHGYFVYSGGTVIASIPSSMTTITIGGLKSGATHTLHVTAVGGGGKEGTGSNTVTITTKSLPGGKTITNYASSPGTDSTTITADILVPYAFIRLYIWDSVGCEFDTNPGWSVNFQVDNYVCTHYMVEGTTLYKYSGILPEGSTAPPWSWSTVGPITLDITGYTYKWTLPLGTSTVDTSKFVVQAQGYNPLTNVFQPDPGAYDCKGSSMCTTPGLLAWCDHAVNYLYRTDDPWCNTNGVESQTGNCWGDQTRGCGVFIQGDNCTISGNDMWNAYQDIRNVGGCSKCGSFHRADGCLVTINYVYSCDNHSRMPMGAGIITSGISNGSIGG